MKEGTVDCESRIENSKGERMEFDSFKQFGTLFSDTEDLIVHLPDTGSGT